MTKMTQACCFGLLAQQIVKMSSEKFQGWGAFGKDSVEGKMKWFDYEPKPFDDDDIEIKVLYCGICGSDVHTASSGWGDMSSMYPMVVGHEIVGTVTKAGSKASQFKEGDLVGIGAQCDSCLDCEWCKDSREQYCAKGIIGTYAGKFGRGYAKGAKTFGGYADKWRGPAHFANHIPIELDPAEAAPMLCGGTTVYVPLKKYGAGTTAKNVGVIGVGGLGHFAIVFAAAMGADVTAISHSSNKEKDAIEMGAKKVIITGDDAKKAVEGHEKSLDLIICSSNDPKMPIEAYLSLLRPGGYFVLVGVPESKLPALSPGTFIFANRHLAGSLIGSPKDIAEVLEFAAKHKVKAWTKKYSMDETNEAVQSMHKGEARYRYVLVNERNGGKL